MVSGCLLHSNRYSKHLSIFKIGSFKIALGVLSLLNEIEDSSRKIK